MTSKLALALLCMGVAACSTLPALRGATPAPGTPPTSSAPHSSQGMPQTANSLPPGARLNAPLAPPTGNVETTRVW